MFTTLRRTCLLLVASLGVACGPPGPSIDPAEHQTYLVYDYDADTATYELRESEIRTLTNPHTVSGELAFVRGGGQVYTPFPDPLTREEFEQSIAIRGDREPAAEYVVQDGVVVPYDFDTQMMVTLYHHLERAHDYFDGVGFDTDRIGRVPVYYFPQLSVLGISLPLFSDNAAYAFTLDAFLIPPRLVLQDDVPLSANRGVIVHEYSHAVFNRTVNEDQRAPDFMFEEFDEDVANEIRSLDEGLADLFAGLATQDPDFISSSISAELFDIDRDLRRERIWDAEVELQVVLSETETGRNPYILGSVFASTLWATRDFLDDVTLAETTLQTMDAIAGPGPDFRAVEFFDAFLDLMPEEHRDEACNLFEERLVLVADQLNC